MNYMREISVTMACSSHQFHPILSLASMNLFCFRGISIFNYRLFIIKLFGCSCHLYQAFAATKIELRFD